MFKLKKTPFSGNERSFIFATPDKQSAQDLIGDSRSVANLAVDEVHENTELVRLYVWRRAIGFAASSARCSTRQGEECHVPLKSNGPGKPKARMQESGRSLNKRLQVEFRRFESKRSTAPARRRGSGLRRSKATELNLPNPEGAEEDAKITLIHRLANLVVHANTANRRQFELRVTMWRRRHLQKVSSKAKSDRIEGCARSSRHCCSHRPCGRFPRSSQL